MPLRRLLNEKPTSERWGQAPMSANLSGGTTRAGASPHERELERWNNQGGGKPRPYPTRVGVAFLSYRVGAGLAPALAIGELFR